MHTSKPKSKEYNSYVHRGLFSVLSYGIKPSMIEQVGRAYFMSSFMASHLMQNTNAFKINA